MSEKNPLKPKLWTERPVAETIQVYSEWAETYDSDLAKGGYHTPLRIAEALLPYRKDLDRPTLDFGCGTGISGVALSAVGIGPLHGTDITREMLNKAEAKGIYDRLWQSEAGAIPASPGTYSLIVATGVISLGAAPPETLSLCLDALAQGDLMAVSFNDPTLESGRYDAVLTQEIGAGRVEVLSRSHGPHLDEMNMGSDVIVLRRT